MILRTLTLLLTVFSLPGLAKIGDTIEQCKKRYGDAIHDNAEKGLHVFAEGTMLLVAMFDDQGECMVFTYMEFGEEGIADATTRASEGNPPNGGLSIPEDRLRKLMKFNAEGDWRLVTENEEKTQWQTEGLNAVSTKGKFVIIDSNRYKAWREAHPKETPTPEAPDND